MIKKSRLLKNNSDNFKPKLLNIFMYKFKY